ncbi:MAG: OmpA family protein [Pseudomonadota bacterium]
MKTISTFLFSTVFIAVVFLASPCRPETENQKMPAQIPSQEPALPDHQQALEIQAGKLGIVGVHFKPGAAEIDDRYMEQLHKIAEALNSEKMLSAKILIKGHSDSKGSADRNLSLSRQRARNAMELLANRFRVDPKRLSYAGEGETAPVASNDTESGRSLNRRIEFIYLGEMDAGP